MVRKKIDTLVSVFAQKVHCWKQIENAGIVRCRCDACDVYARLQRFGVNLRFVAELSILEICISNPHGTVYKSGYTVMIFSGLAEMPEP